MQLILNKTHRGASALDVHRLYQWLFWDVTLSHDYDLLPELQRQDIWHMTNRFGPRANRMEAVLERSPVLREFCKEFEKLRDDFFAMVKDDNFFKWRWTRDPSVYSTETNMIARIFKDLPGHAMQPHLDNNHIIMQTVINLVDNPSSTDIYSFVDSVPIYQSSKQQDRGVTFLNTPGAVHGIRNAESDRYILYSALIYP